MTQKQEKERIEITQEYTIPRSPDQGARIECDEGVCASISCYEGLFLIKSRDSHPFHNDTKKITIMGVLL